MTSDRNWRDAKIPQWAKDSVQHEIDAYRLTAALSWPREAKPEPLPFQWGEYDRFTGDPVPGTYWTGRISPNGGEVVRVRIKLNNGEHHPAWKLWAFSTDGGRWTSDVTRGPLFKSEAEAMLYVRWTACENFARILLRMEGGDA